MNFDEISKLIGKGESSHLEFKESTAQLERVGEALCGFLNKAGGHVIIGVKDNGKILGQTVSDKTQQEIAHFLKKFEPQGRIQVAYTPLPGKEQQVIVLTATPFNSEKPYSYNGRAYERVEATTTIMSQARYQRLLLERSHIDHRWEAQVANHFKLAHLDHKEIRKMIEEGIAAGRIYEGVSRGSVKDMLLGLGLMKQNNLLNAAVVLFASHQDASVSSLIKEYYPQCSIRMARFHGTDKLADFIDSQEYHGHLFSLFDRALQFIYQHLPIASHFEPSQIKRQDIPALPPLAIREALVNAFCHRDYSQPQGEVTLALFDDRMEIWNYGGLPKELTVDDLKTSHPSIRKNKLIADVLYKRGLIEQWGIGTQKMIAYCQAQKLPAPTFTEVAGGLCVAFYYHVPKIAVKHSEPKRLTTIITEGMRESIIAIFLQRQQPLTLREISKLLNESLPEYAAQLSDRAIRAQLYQLQEQHIIKAIGHGRGAKWMLNNKT